MAVTVNTSNLRSDFMISDAAIPQVVTEQNDQFAKFEEMLTKVNEKLEKFKDVKKAYDEGKYDVPTVEELKAAGAISTPETPREIAKKISSGKMKISEIPSDVDMVEVLKELALLKNSNELNKSTDDEIDEDKIFSELKELFGDEFSAQLAVLMGKLAKKGDDDEDKDELLDPNFLASLMSVDVSTEIADILQTLAGEDTDEVEAVEEVELTEQQDLRYTAENMNYSRDTAENETEKMPDFIETAFVKETEDTAETVEVKTAREDVSGVAEGDFPEKTASELPTDSMVKAVEQVSYADTETEAKTVETTVLREETVEAVVQVAETTEEVVQSTEAVEVPRAEVAEAVEIPRAEMTEAVEVPRAEMTEAVEIPRAEMTEAVEIPRAEMTEAVEVPKAEIAETAVQSSEAAELIQSAVRSGEVSKPEVKTYETEKTEASEKTEQVNVPFKAEESVPAKAVDERAKALGEELEMLKNAKQKPETEPKDQDNLSKLAALPNSVTESVVLRKDNGELLVVSQKEVTTQVQQFVEQAITETREQNEYSLMLNPEELGRITVKLTKAADGAVSVTIVAENARTQRMLEQNSLLMQSNLRSNGINLESWQTIGESQQNHPAQDYNGSAKNPYFAREDDSEEEQNEEGRSFADIIAAM